MIDTPVNGTGFSLMIRGRRLCRLVVTGWRPGDRPLCFVEAAAALPEVLVIDGWLSRPRTLLEQLAAGPAEVGTLRNLELEVPDLSASTLAPLSRLPGLTRLDLTGTGALRTESWPCLPRLQILCVDHDLFPTTHED